MKTIDGIEYQDGMTLYVIGENNFGCIALDEYLNTYSSALRVFFKFRNGREGSFGSASCYWGDKQAALREILKRLNEELAEKTISLNHQITTFSAQLLACDAPPEKPDGRWKPPTMMEALAAGLPPEDQIPGHAF